MVESGLSADPAAAAAMAAMAAVAFYASCVRCGVRTCWMTAALLCLSLEAATNNVAAAAEKPRFLSVPVRLAYCEVVKQKDPMLYGNVKLKDECLRLAQIFGDDSICVEEPESEGRPVSSTCLHLDTFLQ